MVKIRQSSLSEEEKALMKLKIYDTSLWLRWLKSCFNGVWKFMVEAKQSLKPSFTLILSPHPPPPTQTHTLLVCFWSPTSKVHDSMQSAKIDFKYWYTFTCSYTCWVIYIRSRVQQGSQLWCILSFMMFVTSNNRSILT